MIQRHLHKEIVSELVEHIHAAASRRSEVHNVASVHITLLKNRPFRPAEIGHITNIARVHQELILEQVDTSEKLLALLVDHVIQDCVLQVAKDVKCTVLDVAVLSLTHEA